MSLRISCTNSYFSPNKYNSQERASKARNAPRPRSSSRRALVSPASARSRTFLKRAGPFFGFDCRNKHGNSVACAKHALSSAEGRQRRQGHKIRSTKSEIRNKSKRSKNQQIPNQMLAINILVFYAFGFIWFRVCFKFRYSDFGLY
jgi:hypothetical protein